MVTQANSVNLLFVVDESGSMAGEHSFLQSQASSIANGLTTVGVTDVNFGLVGFGDSNPAPHLFDINGSTLGSATDFASAATLLRTGGSTEDGYAGIDLAIDSFNNLTGSTFVLLVTDEDRDTLSDAQYSGAPSLDRNSIQQSLTAFNARLVSIVDQSILDSQSTAGLVINSLGQVYTPDGAGDVVRSENGNLGTSSSGNTTDDYSELALDTGGIVADLNRLREGGLTADSFTIAFIDSLVNIILISTGGNFVQLARNSNQFQIAGLVASTISDPQNGNRQFFQSLLTLNPDQKRLLLRLAELQGMRQVGSSLVGGAHTYTFVLDDHFAATARESIRQMSAGDYAERPKWNSFLQIVNNDTEIGNGGNNARGDSDNLGGLTGFDYRWSSGLTTGVAIGYKDDDIDYNNESSSEINTTTVLTYAAWSPMAGLSVEGSFGWSESDIETFRRTSAVGAPTDARGDTDATTISASLGIRYVHSIENFSITPYGRLQWANVDIDGYSENGGGALSATVDGYDIDSVQSVLGVKGEMAIALNNLTLIPFVSGEYVHEFEDDGALVDTTLANQTLTLTTEAPERDYGRLSIGSTLEFSRDASLTLSATQSVGNDFIDTTSIRLSFRYAF